MPSARFTLCTCGCSFECHHTDPTARRCLFCSCQNFREGEQPSIPDGTMLIYAGQVVPGMFAMQVTKFYNQDELRKRWGFVTETTRADLGGNLSVVHLHFQLAERTDMQMYNVNQPVLVADMAIDVTRPLR